MTAEATSSRLEMTGLMERAMDAASRAGAICRRSQSLVTESHRMRAVDASGQPAPRFFVVLGEVQGQTVRAAWFRGSLTATGSLLARMRMLVDLGEEFTVTGEGTPVVAALEEPGPAMLTSVRACDRVRMVRFGPLDRAAALPTV